MKKRLLFIYNPNAGKAKLKGRLCDVIRIFSENGYEVIAAPTQKRKDATEIAYEYAKENRCDRIVCSGGDGTLNEVVTGVKRAGSGIPVGYIPAGTTNDFGYSLKIPKDMLEAAEFAAQKDFVPSDVGDINGECFVYTAAFGLFTDVSYDTPQNIKNVLGRTAYLLSGATKLVNIKSYSMTVEYDEVESSDEDAVHKTAEGEFIYGMISNSDSVGGFKGIAGKNVRFDDGIFEMILIRKLHNIVDLTELANGLLNQKLEGEHAKNIIYAKVKNASFRTNAEELPWSLDGEFGGNMTEAHVQVVKQAVNYIREEQENNNAK